MTLNPVETLNVFSNDLKTALRRRSMSSNLVRTRAPFLRFTTGADMSEAAAKLGSPSFDEYAGYKYFSLGLQGWDNVTYGSSDIYGSRGGKGLIVGVTYNNTEQKLVYTHGNDRQSIAYDDTSTTDSESGATRIGAQTITAAADTLNTAYNFPPPGITSAKVERLRSGNVLRFTLEISVATRDQLEVLDAICFVPGMTCILEWGSLQTTPLGPEVYDTETRLSALKTIDFTKESSVQEAYATAMNTSRENMIDSYCKPNGYNYDFAIANIANVKTRLENELYKVTVIAYGKADNIMYISAYATSTVIDKQKQPTSTDDPASINYFFRTNGVFSNLLKDISRTTSDPRSEKILSFNQPMNSQEVRKSLPTTQTFGVGNEFGFEDTFFLSFDFFVDVILNQYMLNIMNAPLSPQSKLRYVVAPLTQNAQNPTAENADTILVGYNQNLRSTNPQVMIIYNKKAQQLALSNAQTSVAARNALQRFDQSIQNAAQLSTDALNKLRSTFAQGAKGTEESKLSKKPFGEEVPVASGVTSLLKGVWLSSKAIQLAFINARTVYEGLEVLLRNINTATENYWDLKLYYDDDIQSFRILDDNVRVPKQINSDNPIYEFNKSLYTETPAQNNETMGPDVLSIEINSDYPKLLFSQLAVSGINGGSLSSDPSRSTPDFLTSKGVRDVFSSNAEPVQPNTPATPARRSSITLSASDLRVGVTAISRFSPSVTETINNLITTGFPGGIPGDVSSWIRSLIGTEEPLTVSEAEQFKQKLIQFKDSGVLLESGYTTLLNVASLRAQAILTRKKQEELNYLVQSFNNHNRSPEFLATNPNQQVIEPKLQKILNEISTKIKNSNDSLLQQIREATPSVTPSSAITEPTSPPPPPTESQQKTSESGFAGGRVGTS